MLFWTNILKKTVISGKKGRGSWGDIFVKAFFLLKIEYYL